MLRAPRPHPPLHSCDSSLFAPNLGKEPAHLACPQVGGKATAVPGRYTDALWGTSPLLLLKIKMATPSLLRSTSNSPHAPPLWLRPKAQEGHGRHRRPRCCAKRRQSLVLGHGGWKSEQKAVLMQVEDVYDVQGCTLSAQLQVIQQGMSLPHLLPVQKQSSRQLEASSWLSGSPTR